MKQILKYTGVLLFSAIGMSGCAGIAAGFINNPAAGTYGGTFTSSDGHSGTASIELTKLGNVFGDLNDTTASKAGKLTGSVDTDLNFKGKITYPGVADYPVTGQFDSNHGNLTGTLAGSTYSDSFHLTKQ